MLNRIQRFRLQYASNFNISGTFKVQPQHYIKPVKNAHLALLGNIGRPNPELANFLKWCEYQFESIYWIPGCLELSSPLEDKVDIHMRPERIREWLVQQKISRVILCTKDVHTISAPRLTLLSTTMFHPSAQYNQYKLYRYRNGALQLFTEKDAAALQKSETEWILRAVRQSQYPVLCMTAMELFQSPSRFFHSGSVVAQVFGRSIDTKPKSYTGSLHTLSPWIGINMYGHALYNPSAFVEYSEEASVATDLEYTIYDQLEIKSPLPKRGNHTVKPGPSFPELR